MIRLRILPLFCLCLAISAFNIVTPRPGEVISVDEIYNLTWTTDGVPANFIVSTIEIVNPDPAVLYASWNQYVYSQGFGDDASFNISGTTGHYPLNLSWWWSPIYNELPHGSWSISLALYNLAEKRPILTMLNDTVEVNLTSLKVNQNQRPQLAPLQDFAVEAGNGNGRKSSTTSGILQVVLSVVLPVMLISLAIRLVRYQWKRHKYHSLSNMEDVKRLHEFSAKWLPADPTQDNEAKLQASDSILPAAIARSDDEARSEPPNSILLPTPAEGEEARPQTPESTPLTNTTSDNEARSPAPKPIPVRLTTGKNEELITTSQSTKRHQFPRSFILAALLAVTPLLALFSALVILLGLYKVRPSSHSRTDFAINDSSSDPGAFYVDYDPTRYTTIASWTSSIALLLPGFLTTLIWYRQSEQLESDTSLARYDKLLTPYQLSLLLNLKSGTLGSLWEYITYIISSRREKQARFLSDTGFVVFVSTLLGLGLWFADTWLHIGTSTVPFTTAFAYTAPESEFILEPYGRALTRNCTSDYLTSINQNYSCILESSGISDLALQLTDPVSYAAIISGRDYNTAIIPVTLGPDRIAYIGPASPRKQIDYRANTFAVRSLCKSLDEWCWLPYENGFVPTALYAHCGKFIGVPDNSSSPVAEATAMTQGVVGIVTSFFKDQHWQDLMTADNTSNSFYTVSRLDSPLQPSIHGLPYYWSASKADGQVYNNFIGCNTEFVNFTYTFVNGSIRSANIAPLDNLDLINAILLPSMMNYDPFITWGAATTAMSNDIGSAIENWIDTLHMHYLSFAAIAVEEVDNLDQQERFTRLVARIPKAPLFTLGMLILLSMLFNAVILGMAIWRTSLVKANPKQMMVSIAGLAANTFESEVADNGHAVNDIWDRFEESKEESPSTRIGIGENPAGGHRFVAFVT